MSTIENPVQLALAAGQEYNKLYGIDLKSIILFGSAAGGDFDTRSSDINLLIVLTELTFPLIQKSTDLQKKWSKKRFQVPLFMDQYSIENSLDSFPMDFTDMKGCYKVIIGDDVLKDIVITPEHLRLQIERELKGKYLHLLNIDAQVYKKPKLLLQLIYLSLKDFAPVFRCLLQIRKLSTPFSREDLYKLVDKTFNFENQPLLRTFQMCKTKKTDALYKTFSDYIAAVRDIIRFIDG